MTILSAADHLHEARKKHQDAMHFACEFWEPSDLLTCLSAFAEWAAATDVGVEYGPGDRYLAAAAGDGKCIARWGAKEDERFRELNHALHHLHVTLHAAAGVVTREVRAGGLLVKREIELARGPDSM